MADNAVKVISANPVRNGSSVVYVDKLGQGQVMTDRIKPNESLDIQSRYSGKFDDTGYYTA